MPVPSILSVCLKTFAVEAEINGTADGENSLPAC